MAEEGILRLHLHPGDGVPDAAGESERWRGVRHDGEEADHEAGAVGGGGDGGNDDVPERWALEAARGGGGRVGRWSEGPLGAGTVAEVVGGGHDVADFDDFAGERENTVVAVDMGFPG